MQIMRKLVLSLLCLVIVSCKSQQVNPIAISTNTAQLISTNTPTSISTPEVTATGVLMPDGLIMVSPNRYRFLIWPLSFSLPDAWDINNKIHLSSADVGRETYTFYRDDMVDIDSMNESPKITVRFTTIPDGIGIKTYSEETLADWHSTEMSGAKNFDLVGIGVNLDTAMAYKTHFMFEDIEYTQYIIHAIYQTMGIEIIMDSKTEVFENIESEFLYFLKSLTFG